jgi:hypothetical protein
VPAHLTLFHHLPPSLCDELLRRIRTIVRETPAPGATVTGLLDLGNGLALRVQSETLAAIRSDLAEAFAGMLTLQDQAGWRPHVTIQNKVDRAAARALHADLSATLTLPRPIIIAGLAAWRYIGGPWELIRTCRF